MNAHRLTRGLGLAVLAVATSASAGFAAPRFAAPRGSAAAAPPSSGIPAHAVRVYVTDTIDGDTIIVRVNGRHEKVRFKGCDTPETVAPHTPVQPWGKAASHYTRDHCLGEYVWIETAHGAKHDMFGRLLAYVWLADGTCLNKTLVSKGLARVQRRYFFDRLQEYDALERAAKAAKVGIWS